MRSNQQHNYGVNQWQAPPTMMDLLRMKDEEVALLRNQLEYFMTKARFHEEELEQKRFSTIVATPPKSYFNFQSFHDEVLDVPIKKSVSLVEHEESSCEEEALVEETNQSEVNTTINTIPTPGDLSCPSMVEPTSPTPWLDRVKGIHNTPQVLLSIDQSCKEKLRNNVMSDFHVPLENPWPLEREILHHDHVNSFFLPTIINEVSKHDHPSLILFIKKPPPNFPQQSSPHLPSPRNLLFKYKHKFSNDPQHSTPRFIKWIDGHRRNVKFKIGNVVWASCKEEKFSCLLDVLNPSLRSSFLQEREDDGDHTMTPSN